MVKPFGSLVLVVLSTGQDDQRESREPQRSSSSERCVVVRDADACVPADSACVISLAGAGLRPESNANSDTHQDRGGQRRQQVCRLGSEGLRTSGWHILRTTI